MKTRSRPTRDQDPATQPDVDDGETLAEKISRYCTDDFADKLTRHFHRAKRRALAELDTATTKDENRSA
ncbi:MAG TPA: hypothetical protein VFV87_17225 [Pirellulaceae bacterium]|nr:hypothetical protein [Pirellulaceae bacterium]